jgi:hypothetical protein
VTAKGVFVQGLNVFCQPCTDGIQMNVSYQFKQVGVLLTQYGLIAVLKQMPTPAVAPVVGNGISGQQSSHHRRNGHSSAS